MTQKDRWPGWVYGEGEEPDYRFSFANERTFLAWIRTSLALLAAAVAVDVVDLDISSAAQHTLAGILAGLALLSAVVAWVRWATAERAVRCRAPLPPFRFSAVLALGLILVTIIVIATSL